MKAWRHRLRKDVSSRSPRLRSLRCAPESVDFGAAPETSLRLACNFCSFTELNEPGTDHTTPCQTLATEIHRPAPPAVRLDHVA